MIVGEIKRLVKEKGFGFVKGPDGIDRFFHRSAVAPGVQFDNLNEGDRVVFDDDPNATKGPRAITVDLAS